MDECGAGSGNEWLFQDRVEVEVVNVCVHLWLEHKHFIFIGYLD